MPRIVFLCWIGATFVAVGAPAAENVPEQAAIAGLAPYERPADAPILGQFSPELGWRSRSLHGVSEPVPPSLDFIDSQGAWYTPFNHPGMTGRYDLRGWHAPSAR